MRKYMLLVCGKSGTGKSMSLRNLQNPKGVWYFNCEANNELPFDNEFKEFRITDPFQVVEGILAAERKPEVHTIVIDSLTFLLDMYINKHVLPAADPRSEWGNYAIWVQNFFMQHCAVSTKNLIFTAHTVEVMNDSERVLETKVGIQGKKLNVRGIEAFFNTVIATKKMSMDELADYKNPLLTWSEREKALEYKYVFQTQLTKETIHERIRGKFDMWSVDETFIDNDVQLIIDRLRKPAGKQAVA